MGAGRRVPALNAWDGSLTPAGGWPPASPPTSGGEKPNPGNSSGRDGALRADRRRQVRPDPPVKCRQIVGQVCQILHVLGVRELPDIPAGVRLRTIWVFLLGNRWVIIYTKSWPYGPAHHPSRLRPDRPGRPATPDRRRKRLGDRAVRADRTRAGCGNGCGNGSAKPGIMHCKSIARRF